MPEERQTLLIIDDHPLMRRGVIQLLELAPELTVVGEANNGQEGLSLIQQLTPDLVLLDLNMPKMDGLATLRAIRTAEWETKVVVYTVSNAEEDLAEALRAGADGYLLKDMPPLEMLESLQRIAAGEVIISERLVGLLVHTLRREEPAAATASAALSERERQILALIAAGKSSDKVIAKELNIANSTVKVHVRRLLKKLRLHSRVEAAVWAAKHGFNA